MIDLAPIIQFAQQLKVLAETVSAFINPMATLVGVGAILLVQWKTPGPNNGRSAWWETAPGHWVSRCLPFVGPVSAFIVCIGLEWDKSFSMMDVVRGFLSGVVSEFILRVAFKSGFGK